MQEKEIATTTKTLKTMITLPLHLRSEYSRWGVLELAKDVFQPVPLSPDGKICEYFNTEDPDYNLTMQVTLEDAWDEIKITIDLINAALNYFDPEEEQGEE